MANDKENNSIRTYGYQPAEKGWCQPDQIVASAETTPPSGGTGEISITEDTDEGKNK